MKRRTFPFTRSSSATWEAFQSGDKPLAGHRWWITDVYGSEARNALERREIETMDDLAVHWYSKESLMPNCAGRQQTLFAAAHTNRLGRQMSNVLEFRPANFFRWGFVNAEPKV